MLDRTTLRRMVLAFFGDYLLLTATAPGTTTTFIDADHIVGEPGRFSAREAYVSGGTAANRGQTRFVKSSSRDTATITFSRALPAATAVGDEIELCNAYGIGVTHRMVHDALNYALQVASADALLPAVSDLPDPFDGQAAYTVDVPADWVAVDKVQAQRGEVWYEVRHAGTLGADGWAVDRANAQVRLSGAAARQADTQLIRLYGYTVPAPLLSDSDTTAIDPEWLIHTAAGHMALNMLASRQASSEWQSKGLLWSKRADELRARLSPRLGPNFTRVRP